MDDLAYFETELLYVAESISSLDLRRDLNLAFLLWMADLSFGIVK